MAEETQFKLGLDDIKRKIAAMMDTNGKTKEEAAAASAMALKLAAKYNLDLAQAAGWKPGEYTTLDIKIGRSRWRRELLATICEYCFCKSYYRPAEGTNFIVGERHNQELVEMMCRTLIEHIEPMAQRAYLTHGRGEAHAKHWKDQFYSGANRAISTRLHRLQLQQTEYKTSLPESYDDAETITIHGAQGEDEVVSLDITDSDIPAYRALIVTKQDALEVACDRLVGKVGNVRPKKWKWDTTAYHHGYKVGEAAPLSTYKQIEGAK